MVTKKEKAKPSEILCRNCWWNLVVHLECAKRRATKCDDFTIEVGG